MTLQERLKASLIAGLIGDSAGGFYEGTIKPKIEHLDHPWHSSDDTQLSIATAQALMGHRQADAEAVAKRFLHWFNYGKLSGLGGSTIKALKALQKGVPAKMSGNTGKYAAGNGAAMRIAPLAFCDLDPDEAYAGVRDLTAITHRNLEAYAGALAVYFAIDLAVKGKWKRDKESFRYIDKHLPATSVKQHIGHAGKYCDELTIEAFADRFGCGGYVVESVPLALFAAAQMDIYDLESLFIQLISVGGDTDTNCSICGQLVGAAKGMKAIPVHLFRRIETSEAYYRIEDVAEKW